MKGFKSQIQSGGNFNQPADKNFSHVDVNVSLPCDVVFGNYWFQLVCFDIIYNLLGVVSDFRTEVFGVWERILNLNFAGRTLNFENLADFAPLGSPPQREDSFGSLLVFEFVTVRFGVDRALIRIHRVLLLFQIYIFNCVTLPKLCIKSIWTKAKFKNKKYFVFRSFIKFHQSMASFLADSFWNRCNNWVGHSLNKFKCAWR